MARVPQGDRGPRHRGRPARHLRRPRGTQAGHPGGLPGRGLAALRRPPHARLRALGLLPGAQEARGQDRGARLPSKGPQPGEDGVPPGMRDAPGVLPQGRPRPRGGRARRPRLPRPPEVALEAPAHQQRAGEDQQGDQAQAKGGAGVPLGGVADPPGGGGAVRVGRGVVGVALLLGGEDLRALRGQAEARAANRGAQRGAQARDGAGDQGEPRACGLDGGGIGYWTRSQILQAIRSLGRGEPGAAHGFTPTFSTLPASHQRWRFRSR